MIAVQGLSRAERLYHTCTVGVGHTHVWDGVNSVVHQPSVCGCICSLLVTCVLQIMNIDKLINSINTKSHMYTYTHAHKTVLYAQRCT